MGTADRDLDDQAARLAGRAVDVSFVSHVENDTFAGRDYQEEAPRAAGAFLCGWGHAPAVPACPPEGTFTAPESSVSLRGEKQRVSLELTGKLRCVSRLGLASILIRSSGSNRLVFEAVRNDLSGRASSPSAVQTGTAGHDDPAHTKRAPRKPAALSFFSLRIRPPLKASYADKDRIRYHPARTA